MNRFTIYTTVRFGSEESVEELCNHLWQLYFPKVSFFIRQHLGNHHSENADICQEILTKALISLNDYNPGWAFSTWLYRIARNHLIDYRKSKSYRFRQLTENALPEDMHPTYSTPESEAINDESVARIEAFIEQLKPIQREIAFLRFAEELNSREIGNVLDLPDSTVRYHIHEIRKDLKDLRKNNHE